MKTFYILSFLVLVSIKSEAGTTYQQKLQSSIQTLRSKTNVQDQSTAFYKVMTDSVFPSWMGTKWDFNGISNVPGQGQIACGYFVSTTLKHVGFNLNRYKMAQQAASVIVNILCENSKKHEKYQSELIQQLKSAGNNKLYVVGLDYHVGFLAVENNQVYFIHSDYYLGKVVCEVAADSKSFWDSNSYVYGELTNNSQLLNKWKNGTKIY